MLDKDMVAKARTADVLAFFHSHCGYTFTLRQGTYRSHQHPSLAVKADRLSWYWHSKGIGGYGALDYLMKIENMPFRAAVEAVLGTTPTIPPPPRPTPPKRLVLPPKAGLPLRLYDYLCCRRGIDNAIVNVLMQEGKLYEDKQRNVVFVGFDEHGTPCFANVRGTGVTKFHMDCAGSDKRYGFNMTFSESAPLYVFESPIDAMSHASMTENWKSQSRLSLAGTSDVALAKYLEIHLHVKKMILCLDNDPAGRNAADQLAQQYARRGFSVEVHSPKGKDFNDDLLARNIAKVHSAPERTL